MTTEKRNAWLDANADKLKAYQKAYQKAYRDANPEKKKSYNKKWRDDNPEKVKAWYSNKVDVHYANQSKKRALSFNKLHPDHDFEIERSLCFLAKNCEAVFGEPFDIDHILPYTCGGWHHHENLQVIPSRINRKKHNNPDYQSNWPNFKTWRDLPEFLIAEKNF